MFTELIYLLIIYLFIGMLGAAGYGMYVLWEMLRDQPPFYFPYVLLIKFLILVAWPIMLIIWIRGRKPMLKTLRGKP